MKQKTPYTDLLWYKLDNAAKIFPAISDSSNSNVFRLICELTKPIDRETLQLALDKTIVDFQSFQVRLRRGLFWHFLEHNPDQPKVHRDIHPPCTYFKSIKNKGFLFEVSYFKNKINLDLFHVITDGTGGLQFIRTLVYHYITLAHKGELTENQPPSDCEAPPMDRSEDSFSKYYDKTQKNAPFEKSSYHILGTKLPLGDVRIISGKMPVKQVLGLSKQNHATLTAYIGALILYAIYKENMPPRHRKKPIKVNIPVNLRNHFPSITSRNFFACIEAGYAFSGEPPTFEQVLESVDKQIKRQLTAEGLSKRINYTVATERNYAVRFVPLLIKNAVLRIAYRKGEKVYSTALSNLGKVDMPAYLSDYINGFELIMSTSPQHPVKFGICTFKDQLTLTFSSSMGQTDIPRYIFRYLAEQGVDITLTSNEVK